VLINAAPYNGAIVVGDWKLVRNGHIFCMISTEGQEDRYELFNLADDMGETSDLSEQFPEKVKELRKRLDKHTREAVTPFNTPSPWPPAPPKGPKPKPGEKYPQRWRDNHSGTPKAWGHEE
jgi:hypothetical protein